MGWGNLEPETVYGCNQKREVETGQKRSQERAEARVGRSRGIHKMS